MHIDSSRLNVRFMNNLENNINFLGGQDLGMKVFTAWNYLML
jgi:hypothetical protein